MKDNDSLIIKPSKGVLELDLKKLIQIKDLFLLLAYRDYRVRYAQTFLGLFYFKKVEEIMADIV